MGPPPPPMPGQMYHPGPMLDSMGPNASHRMEGHNISRTSSRNSNGHGSINSRRGGCPRARGSWTYGPGNGTPGFNYNINGPPNGMAQNEAYGPRLSTNMRRQSGTSSGGSAGARTPADETSSTAVSGLPPSRFCQFPFLLGVDLVTVFHAFLSFVFVTSRSCSRLLRLLPLHGARSRLRPPHRSILFRRARTGPSD